MRAGDLLGICSISDPATARSPEELFRSQSASGGTGGGGDGVLYFRVTEVQAAAVGSPRGDPSGGPLRVDPDSTQIILQACDISAFYIFTHASICIGMKNLYHSHLILISHPPGLSLPPSGGHGPLPAAGGSCGVLNHTSPSLRVRSRPRSDGGIITPNGPPPAPAGASRLRRLGPSAGPPGGFGAAETRLEAGQCLLRDHTGVTWDLWVNAGRQVWEAHVIARMCE